MYPASLTDDVVRLVRGRAEAGAGPADVAVLGIGGRSGAGKSTLAADAVAALRAESGRDDAVVPIAIEDYYRGWDGLIDGVLALRPVLAELRVGRSGSARTWDWHADGPGPVRPTPPPAEPAPGGTGVVVVEGCGVHLLRDDLDILVWLDEPEDVRRRRAEARDGDVTSWWDRWTAQERAAHASLDPLTVADLVLRPRAG